MDKNKISGKKIFGQRLKFLREIRGLTQEQLARAVNLEYQTISRIETGMYFTSYENLTKIASVLNVPLKKLFEFEEDKDKDKNTLKLEITNYIENCSDKELEFLHSLITNLKKLKI